MGAVLSSDIVNSYYFRFQTLTGYPSHHSVHYHKLPQPANFSGILIIGLVINYYILFFSTPDIRDHHRAQVKLLYPG